MCATPQEVLNRETGEINTISCRVCDQCIAVRRHGWVARAMAEKSMWKHSLVVALTYDNETQENRDGAAMFAYADVRDFLKRLLSASRYAEAGSQIKFLCAGEQGSRNGRCHWHLILYSDLDLRTLGDMVGVSGPVTAPEKMLSVGKRKVRLNWSLWGRGFVTFQTPDQGGMHYVLSYCLKDQFSVEKSEGTMRHAKGENFATGLFRMSKKPAIGEAWVIEKMERLLEGSAVLPSLKLTIPGFRGFWHPTGTARKRVLWHLKAAANLIKWRTGAMPLQWGGLLHSLQDNPSDMEILHGQETETEVPTLEAALDFKQRETAQRLRDAETRRRCGGRFPCEDCCQQHDDQALSALGVYRQGDKAFDYFTQEGGSQIHSSYGWAIDLPEGWAFPLNQSCLQRHSKDVRRVFPSTRQAQA